MADYVDAPSRTGIAFRTTWLLAALQIQVITAPIPFHSFTPLLCRHESHHIVSPIIDSCDMLVVKSGSQCTRIVLKAGMLSDTVTHTLCLESLHCRAVHSTQRREITALRNHISRSFMTYS